MKIKYFLAIPTTLICCLSFTGCEKSNETVVGLKNEVVEKESFEKNVDNDLMLDLVNEVRVSGCDCKEENGSVTKMTPVNPLTWSNDLAKIAKDHYSSMETKKNIDRKDLNRKSVGDRLVDARYFWSAVAENFAMGQKTEKEVFDTWLNSTHGDCKNIMNPKVKEMGVARSNDDTDSWTQLFGTRR